MFFLAFVLLVKFATHPVTVAILRQCTRLVLKTTAGLSNVPEIVVVQTGAYAIACTIAVEERLMEAAGATVRRRARGGSRPGPCTQAHQRIAERQEPTRRTQ